MRLTSKTVALLFSIGCSDTTGLGLADVCDKSAECQPNPVSEAMIRDCRIAYDDLVAEVDMAVILGGLTAECRDVWHRGVACLLTLDCPDFNQSRPAACQAEIALFDDVCDAARTGRTVLEGP